jgi:MFS family permease
MSRFKWGPLGVPAFRLLASGQFASTIGDYCYAVALPWFVLSNHGSTILLGTVLVCYGVPRTILIPLGGVLADKVGPRVMMLSADLMPASFSIMPSLLAEEQLQAGNALSQGLTALGSMVGPVLGGAMVAAAGPAPAFWVDAASFAVSAAALALIRPASEPGNTASEPGNTSMLTLLRRSRILRFSHPGLARRAHHRAAEMGTGGVHRADHGTAHAGGHRRVPDLHRDRRRAREAHRAGGVLPDSGRRRRGGGADRPDATGTA